MNVTLYGAAGPVAEAAIKSIEAQHRLRLTDVNVDALSKYRDRHEVVKCDISNPREVLAAAAGMDVLINFTVNRPHPKLAFDVNCRGAINVMRAAKAHGIRRVIHTGPQLIHTGYAGDYTHDWDLPDDVPSRPGTTLYPLTKHLGQEACRVFAEEYGIEVICLLFSNFYSPDQGPVPHRGIRSPYPYSVSWADAGESFRCALDVKELPRKFETVDIFGNVPEGIFAMTKARRLLGWQPKEDNQSWWKRKK